MAVADLVDQFVSTFARDEAGAKKLLSRLMSAPAHEAMPVIVARLHEDDPLAAAWLALCAGALIEGGADPAPLARALAAPVARALLQAAEGDARAKESLDTWYRPVAASWTRHRPSLDDAKADAKLRALVHELERDSHGAHWLARLLATTSNARFIVLVPELDDGLAAWSFRADGVSDTGQLTVLLADALREPLARFGYAPPSARAVHALSGVIRDASENDGGTYAEPVHLYAWQALDRDAPADGAWLPVAGRFMWTAPGGTGTHSLPADFEPEAIEPIDGVRVVVLCGPKAPLPFTRVLSSQRIFSGLQARVDDVAPLERDVVARWHARIRELLP